MITAVTSIHSVLIFYVIIILKTVLLFCSRTSVLTCEFVVAEYQTFVRILYPFCFQDVTCESFSTL